MSREEQLLLHSYPTTEPIALNTPFLEMLPHPLNATSFGSSIVGL